MRVTALTRNPAKADFLRAHGVNVVEADLAGDAWHGAVPRPDWVVNCVSSGGGGAAGFERVARAAVGHQKARQLQAGDVQRVRIAAALGEVVGA